MGEHRYRKTQTCSLAGRRKDNAASSEGRSREDETGRETLWQEPTLWQDIWIGVKSFESGCPMTAYLSFDPYPMFFTV